MKLTALATLAAIGLGQWVYFHPKPPKIKQRYVQVYVMAPEGNSVIWEARNE